MKREPETTGRPAESAARTPLLPALRWWICGVLFLLVVVAVTLPTQTLAVLRQDFDVFGIPLLWLDNVSASLPLDLTHVALFSLVGFAMAILWPRARWWQLAMPLVLLSVGSELLQFWVPGREPRIGDVVDDLIGAALGYLLSMPLRSR